MAPILIKRSAFQVLDAGCFWLSETPGVPGSLSWGSYFPRTVTWAKLIAKQEQGRVLYFFNTHFDYANLQVQVESAELLKKHIASLRNRPPVILCGDFNIEKDSTPYQALLEEDFIPMHDCYRAANPGPWKDEGTFHDFGTLSKPQVLDWILISSNFHTVASDIDRYQLGDLFPSDHFPLTTRVSW
jgi:endonuclease/exonuclease/phosphatase family metal-dependent hydrolase